VHLLARCTQVRLENRTENAHTDTQPPARPRVSPGARFHSAQLRRSNAVARRRGQTSHNHAQNPPNTATTAPTIPPARIHPGFRRTLRYTGVPVRWRSPACCQRAVIPLPANSKERESERESNLVNRRTDGRSDTLQQPVRGYSLCSRRLPVYTSKAACRRSISAARRQAGRRLASTQRNDHSGCRYSVD